jgi:hypothetical protein
MEKKKQVEPHAVASPLFDVKEALAYLKVSQSCLYTMMDRFERVKIGKRIFLTRKSCDDFLQANMIKPRRQRRDERERASA